ncbi:unnamed protein product [Cylindrotheca closterium]|uniref:ubiquitinyl hydrolase 1 n=1 Tax=Cylindrotheca closterium TaxID=2856 RepID=A0AAD2CPD9_9STRA|nr:unnamed protein product [Cylindrotheca closterium]
MPNADGLPYHESQALLRQLCLMHALNMLVGEPRLNQAHMDQVCNQLVQLSPEPSVSTTNPHRGRWLGGNYDVNVAIYILENEWNYQVNYYSRRRTPKNNSNSNENMDESVEESSSLSSMEGVLVNVPGTFPWTRHWIMYKPWNRGEGAAKQQWYRLDSKAACPIQVKDLQVQVDKHSQTGDTVLTIQKQQGE